jgi:hypothetical protein
LKETLNALINNEEAAESDLYIYCDGPKVNADKKNLDLIKQVRELARSKKWCKNVYIIESESNKGLAQSIVTGVTDVISKYGRIIVVEDDIVVAPFFLKYMNDALELYKNEEKVASISGHNFPISDLITQGETFFIKSTSSWGWATWARAWQLYEDDAAELLLKVKNSKQEKEFNFNDNNRFIKMLTYTINGKVDSWASKWYTSCFLNNKLTLYPTHSMIKNIGMVGTHIVGDNTDFVGNKYFEGEIKVFENTIVENKKIREIFENHFKKHNRRRLTYKNVLYAISKFRMKFNI